MCDVSFLIVFIVTSSDASSSTSVGKSVVTIYIMICLKRLSRLLILNVWCLVENCE